jgi:hypothetical protein
MVDTGANPSFISKQFCIKNNITITPDQSDSQISRAGLLENKTGTVAVSIKNGTGSYHNLKFTVLDYIDFDLIHGRNYHQMFGYRLLECLPNFQDHKFLNLTI